MVFSVEMIRRVAIVLRLSFPLASLGVDLIISTGSGLTGARIVSCKINNLIVVR